MIKNGTVIVIGGNEEKRIAHASILRTFVDRAGGAAARIVIIPSASQQPEKRAERYTRIFKRLGAVAIHAVHAERGQVTPDELLLIENATGIFVAGGDQVRLMEHLRRTGCASAIVEAVRSGAVYAGTSAGASAASKRMIAGSTRTKNADVVEFAEGLGLLEGVIVDQHFSERRRLTRLMTAVTEHGLQGVGVDENTALIFERGGVSEVTGAGTVTVVDPHESEHAIHSSRIQILGSGKVVRG